MAKKKKTLADLGKTAIEIDKVYVLPEEATRELVRKLTEPTALDLVEAELHVISPTLSGLKHNDPARYKEAYKRFMWLVAERDRLQNG